MKLYATTTSERGKPAHKGGNESLQIVITCGDDRQILTTIDVRRIEQNVVLYTAYCNDELIAQRIATNEKSESKRIAH